MKREPYFLDGIQYDSESDLCLAGHNPDFDLPEEVDRLNNNELLSLLACSRDRLISVPQAVAAMSAYEKQWPQRIQRGIRWLLGDRMGM